MPGRLSYKGYQLKVIKLENEIKAIKKTIPEHKDAAVKEARKKWRIEEKEKLRQAKKAMAMRYQVWVRKISIKIKQESKAIANKTLSKRLDYKRLYGTNHLDGVMAYPIIFNYAGDNNVSPMEMMYLIIICMVGNIKPKDAPKYGINKRADACRAVLDRMVGYGLLEVFERDTTRLHYTPSVKGMAFFKAYKSYSRKVVKQLLSTDEYKRKAHKWN